MLKRSVSVTVCIAFLLQVMGCTSLRELQYDQLDGELFGVVIIMQKDGSRTELDRSAPNSPPDVWPPAPATRVVSDTLYSYVDRQPITVPLDQIQGIEIREIDGRKTAALIGGFFTVSVIAVLFMAISKGSSNAIPPSLFLVRTAPLNQQGGF